MFENVHPFGQPDAPVDPAAVTDEELCEAVLEAERACTIAEARRARLVAAWDARRAWAPSGARSGAAWLAWKARLPRPLAGRRVRVARGLATMPEAAQAWAAGDIGEAQVHRLLRARNPRSRAEFPEAEARLVATAREARYSAFDRQVAYWLQEVDPDGCDQSDRDRYDQRDVSLVESIEGMWFGRLTLDPISGSIVGRELQRLEGELFEADWAEAKQRLGVEQPSVDQLARTPAQRRADALVEMASRSNTAPADGRRPAPLFSVLVGLETFAGPVCELAGGTVLSPGSLTPWLDRAVVERAVFDGPARVLEVGRQRTFRGALRRAVELRDRICFHPSCEEPAEHADVDHERPVALGGATTLANGRPGCGFHNRRRNRHPDPADVRPPGAWWIRRPGAGEPSEALARPPDGTGDVGEEVGDEGAVRALVRARVRELARHRRR